MGNERLLDEEELELEDLDEEAETEEEEAANAVPDTTMDLEEDEDGLELEDLDEEDAASEQQEGGEAQAAAPQSRYERMVAGGDKITQYLKGKADTLFDAGLSKAGELKERYKDKFFEKYDQLKDFKDEVHYASKDAGGGWEGFKSGARVVGDHIKNSETYQKMDRAGKWIKNEAKAGWNAVKSGASYAVDKVKNSKVGQLGKKAWEDTKSGASYLADKVKNSKVGQFGQKVWDGTKRAAAWTADKAKTGASVLAEKAKNTKLGQWIQKKMSEKSDEPGVMSKAWNAVKSGASAAWDGTKRAAAWTADKAKSGASFLAEKAKNGASFLADKAKSGASFLADKAKTGASFLAEKAKNSKLGQWIQKKMSEKSDEPGVMGKAWNAVKGGASALITKVQNSDTAKWLGTQAGRAKQWVAEQKDWANDKLERLKQVKNDLTDELDDHEHARRVRFMERRGDADYGKRYDELVEALKEEEGIQRLKGLVNAEELDQIVVELESGKADPTEAVGSAAKAGSGVIENVRKIKDKKVGEKKVGENILNAVVGKDRMEAAAPIIKYGKEGLDAVKSGADIAKNAVQLRRLNKMKDRVMQGSNDTLKKGLQFSENKNKRGIAKGVTGVVKSGVTVAGTALGSKTAAKFLNKAVDALGSAATSGMDKDERKLSLKGALGGVEGYKKLKERYKLKAPEMRRAIRQAVGVSSEDDVLNMDKAMTSREITQAAKDGDEDSIAFMKASSMGGPVSSTDLYKRFDGADQIYRTKAYG